MHDSLRLRRVLLATGLVAAAITLAQFGQAGAIAGRESVYVTGRVNQLHVFDGTNLTLSQTINASAAGAQFNAIVASPDGSRVYRTSHGQNQVLAFSTVTDTLVATIPVMGDPRALQVSPDGEFLYVSNLSGTIHKIRLSDGTNVRTISNGSGTYGMGISADGAFLFVPNNGSNVVAKVRTSDGVQVATVSTGAGAGTRWVHAAGGYVVATNYSTHKVSIIDEATFTELGQVATGTNPIGVTLNPSATVAYVASERSNRIDVIDLVNRTSLRTVGLSNRPWGVATNSTGGRLYVGTYMQNSMFVVNTSSWSVTNVALASDQTMTIAVVNAPVNEPTTTTSSTSTTTSSTTTTIAPTTTTSSTTTTIAPTTTTSSTVAPATTTTVAAPSSTTSTAVPPATTTVASSQTTTAPNATTPVIAPAGSTAPPDAVVTTSPARGSTAATVVATTTTSTTVAPTTTSTTVPAPDAPDAAPGEAGATVDGEEINVDVERANNALVVSAADVTATVYGTDAAGERVALDADGNLRLEEGDSVVIEASGYEPGSEVAFWLRSTPVRLGVRAADTSGAVTGRFAVPSSVDPGDHRVILSGLTAAGGKSIIGVGLRIGAYGKESGLNKWLIILPLVLATMLALVIPTTARRRRRAHG